MKAFSKMAKAIRDAEVSKDHTSATADFIDSEFSDNSGCAARARAAPIGSWKRNRFDSACTKVARILEDRCPIKHTPLA